MVRDVNEILAFKRREKALNNNNIGIPGNNLDAIILMGRTTVLIRRLIVGKDRRRRRRGARCGGRGLEGGKAVDEGGRCVLDGHVRKQGQDKANEAEDVEHALPRVHWRRCCWPRRRSYSFTIWLLLLCLGRDGRGLAGCCCVGHCSCVRMSVCVVVQRAGKRVVRRGRWERMARKRETRFKGCDRGR